MIKKFEQNGMVYGFEYDEESEDPLNERTGEENETP